MFYLELPRWNLGQKNTSENLHETCFFLPKQCQLKNIFELNTGTLIIAVAATTDANVRTAFTANV